MKLPRFVEVIAWSFLLLFLLTFGLMIYANRVFPDWMMDPGSPSVFQVPKAQVDTYVTIDGMENGHVVCPLVNVWSHYSNHIVARRVVVRVEHGARVELVGRFEESVLIRVPGTSRSGWVTYYFIKEYK